MKRILLLIAFPLLFSCHFPDSEGIAAIYNLPAFRMLLVDSTTTLDASQIPTGKPIVLLYFRPDCPYCQAETKNLIENINRLKNVNIYMTFTGSLRAIKAYYQSYHLNHYQNITVGKDLNRSFASVFKTTGVPYTVIYTKNKTLVRIYTGEADIQSLISDIQI